jgi:eukaryotic-like serine/threonine-protein kinase
MPSPAGLLREGELLAGRYEIKRTLGVGGMGAVYEAMHVRLHRPAAIKVLLPEFAATQEFQARFEQEARAAAALKSPHVVRVYDVDTSPEGLAFIVMELLDGNDLGQEADRRDIPASELVDWIAQACAGLQEAHDRGIVHRDLKPVNIFLAKTPEGPRIAKLLDFGISRITHARTQITRPNDGVLGTPKFMAPEQVRGRTVDHRADIWAMGVVLYHLLSRAWPFDGPNDHAYLAAVISDPPVPLLTRRPDLPPGLAAAVMHALQRQPEDRMQSARALAEALAPYGGGRAPLAARPLPASDPALWGSLPPPAMGSARGVATRVDRAAPIEEEETVRDTPAAREAVSATVTRRSSSPLLAVGLALLVATALVAVVFVVVVRARQSAAALSPDPAPSATSVSAAQGSTSAETSATAAPTTNANATFGAPLPPPTGVVPESDPSAEPSASARTGPGTARPRPSATSSAATSAPAPQPSADLPPFL